MRTEERLVDFDFCDAIAPGPYIGAALIPASLALSELVGGLNKEQTWNALGLAFNRSGGSFRRFGGSYDDRN